MFAVSDAEVISYVNLFTSNGGFVGIYDQHRSSALEAYKSGKRYVMRGDGYGTTDVGLFFKEPISNEVDHMEEAVIQPFMMTNGLTEDTTVQLGAFPKSRTY